MSPLVPEPVAFYPLNKQFTTNDVKKRRQIKGNASSVAFTRGPFNASGGAYEFPGSCSSYIEFPNGGGILDVKHSITLMCWVRPGGRDGPIFNYNKANWGVHLWIVSGTAFIRITEAGTHAFQPSINTYALRVGKWVHVAATYNHTSGDNSIYVNGKLNSTTKVRPAFRISTNDSEVRMGARIGDGRCFKGAITQMVVYNVALNAKQIMAVAEMNAGKKKLKRVEAM